MTWTFTPAPDLPDDERRKIVSKMTKISGRTRRSRSADSMERRGARHLAAPARHSTARSAVLTLRAVYVARSGELAAFDWPKLTSAGADRAATELSGGETLFALLLGPGRPGGELLTRAVDPRHRPDDPDPARWRTGGLLSARPAWSHVWDRPWPGRRPPSEREMRAATSATIWTASASLPAAYGDELNRIHREAAAACLSEVRVIPSL